ncbi:hypothetical protein [Serratia fonticola]
MDFKTLWLKAVDSLVIEYLREDLNSEFDTVAILSALQNAADVLYYVDHSLSAFISDKTREWYYNGMKTQVNFYDKWQKTI